MHRRGGRRYSRSRGRDDSRDRGPRWRSGSRGRGGKGKGKGKGKGSSRGRYRDSRSPRRSPSRRRSDSRDRNGRRSPRRDSPGQGPPGQGASYGQSSYEANSGYGGTAQSYYDYYGSQRYSGAWGSDGAAALAMGPSAWGYSGAAATAAGDQTAAAAAMSSYTAMSMRRDYADEKPDAYRAFLAHVRHGVDGPEVSLSDKMCLDHHVADLLLCLESWLMREHGPPQVVGKPWRLGRLDLARNNLTDDSISSVMGWLTDRRVRVRRLDMDSNAASSKGMSALVEYVWNCPEAVLELGIANNEIKIRTTDEDDPVSALLRCLYNHAGYPEKAQSEAGVQVLPLILRLNGNFIAEGQRLLQRTAEKGGVNRVKFCDSAAAYASTGEEYVAVFLPGFNEQHKLVNSGGDAAVDPQAAAVRLSDSPSPARPAGEDAGAKAAPQAKRPLQALQIAGGPASCSSSGSSRSSSESPPGEGRPNASAEAPLEPAKPLTPLDKVRMGEEYVGKVTLVRQNFALVCFGAEVDGLLHVRDLLRSVKAVKEALREGDVIGVEVKSLCRKRERVRLRQRLLLDPSVEPAPQAAEDPAPKPKPAPSKPVKRAAPKEAPAAEPKAANKKAAPPKPAKPAEAVATAHVHREKKRVKVKKHRSVAAPQPDDAPASAAASVDSGGEVADAPVTPAHARDDSFGDIVDENMNEEDKSFLQKDIIKQLEATSALARNDKETQQELSEFVVCMLQAKKKPSEVKEELIGFLQDNAGAFVDWLATHMKGQWLVSRRARAGATPKAAAKKGKTS